MRSMPSFKRKSTDKEAAISAEFINQHGYRYHEALGEKALYNEETTWFDPVPESEDTTSGPSDDLQIALEEYNATTEEKYRLKITSYSLNDVLLEIVEAEGRYKEKGKGIINSPRHIGRSVGDYADAITPWVDLIPSDNGLSILTAGLKAILNIAKKNAENRQKILQALYEIPNVMLRTQKQQNIFSAVPKLKDEAIALYGVLAHSLAHLIATLNPSKSKEKFRDHAKRFGKKFIPYHTATEIDQILGGMKTGVGKFGDSLQLIRDEFLAGAYHNGDKILTQGSATQTDLSTLARKFEENRIEQRARHKELVDSKNCFHLFIRSDFPNTPFFPTLYTAQPPQPQSFLSDTELFYALGVQLEEAIEDVDLIIKRLNQFNITAQTQAQQLLSSEQFMGWIKSSLPETLFVKGNFQAGPSRISALSVLCATISLNISKNTNYIVLHTFCGLHEGQHYPNAGPNWLIRSLIAQLLLTRIQFNLDFINTRSFAEQIKSHCLQELCSVFRQLIEQLPKEATVICIIDGVTWLESETWKTDLIDVLYILNQVVLNEFLKPSFKLLLTTQFSNTTFIETPGTFWAHYTVNLLPVGTAGGQRISERSVLRRLALEEPQPRMQEYEENELDLYGGGGDDDIFF
ncbi:unnamed protein product [Penicillium glandicola]